MGKALPGFELRLAPDGELEMRSETIFAGYYKDAAATAEVLDDDGWLRTGDIATIDEDGFVTITDRKKDIIVTAGGKNIAPQNLENDLKASRYVSQALVVGDRRPYPVALITLDPAEIAKWAAEQQVEATVAELARDERVVAIVQGIVDDVNRDRTPLRADQAVRSAAARLRAGAGRDHSDAQAQAPRGASTISPRRSKRSTAESQSDSRLTEPAG